MRRSSRPRCTPVEFWNFEKPDYSVSHEISYNLSVLGAFTKRNGNSILQKNSEDTDFSLLKRTTECSVVLKDILKAKSSNRKTIVSDSQALNRKTAPVTPVKNSKQVIPSCVSNLSPHSLLRATNVKVNVENKSNSGKAPILLENQPAKKKVETRRPNESSNFSNIQATVSITQEPVPTSIGSKDEKHFKRVSEEHDSGVTDLGSSFGQTLHETRTADNVAEISNIQLVHQEYQDIQVTERPDDILSNLSSINNYCKNRKPPNFLGVMSSTALSEADINKFNSGSNNTNDGSDVFKRPNLIPRNKLKKMIVVEPSLCSIAEEQEQENVPPINLQSGCITPRNKKLLRRSRLLESTDFQDENVVRDIQPRRSIDKGMKVELKENANGFPRNCEISTEIASQNITTQSDIGGCRRSSRPRIRRLEFWNFETAHITTMNSGEVSVAYTKLDDPSKIQSSKVQNNTKFDTKAQPAVTDDNIKLRENKKIEVPKKSLNDKRNEDPASKRKVTLSNEESSADPSKCKKTQNDHIRLRENKKVEVPKKSLKDKRNKGPASERKVTSSNDKKSLNDKRNKDPTSKRKVTSSNEESSADPSITPSKRKKTQSAAIDDFSKPFDIVSFSSLEFVHHEEEDYTCYLARSYCNKHQDMYAGFLFLEKGEMIWSTSKYTTFCVIEGEGALTILDSDDDGTLIWLSENVKAVVSAGKKVRLEKEDSDNLLKVFILLQNKPCENT